MASNFNRYKAAIKHLLITKHGWTSVNAKAWLVDHDKEVREEYENNVPINTLVKRIAVASEAVNGGPSTKSSRLSTY